MRRLPGQEVFMMEAAAQYSDRIGVIRGLQHQNLGFCELIRRHV